jgi:hypothetical protein
VEKVKRKHNINQSAESIQIDEERKGVYLYCIFYGREYTFQLVRGIDNINPIFTITYGDIEALASYVPLSEYNEESLEKNLQDVKWITPRAQAHEIIIESVMHFCTVIPIKFCTIFKDESNVSEILKQNYEKLKSLLNYLEDKEELGIKVYFDSNKIGKVEFGGASSIRSAETVNRAIGGSNIEIEDIPVASEGAAYFLKKKRDEMLKENSEKILDGLAEKIFEKFKSWAIESRQNRLLGKQSTGRNDEMILNIALLLKKSDVEEVKSKIDELASVYSSKGLFFELSGPWPPYNFCTEGIEVV